MVDILALALLHDEGLVERAITEAREVEPPSKQHVLNGMSRLSDGPKPKPTFSHPALKLVTEPVADTGRHDRLRGNQQ
jgi:hypothetical protein